jgi:hypothetical protein
LYSPPANASVSVPPLLAWRAVRGARYYNVQLYRRGRKILSLWPRTPRLQLHRKWIFRGHAQRLRPGVHVWAVWPAYGTFKHPRYGRMLGLSMFRFVPR